MSAVTDVVGGQSWTVRELFGRRFLVDPYQRDYQWRTEHVQDLINDLTSRFERHYRPEHEIRHVAGYEPYFLGPVVINRTGDEARIVDGQQRMTTLMLLLISLHRLQADREDAVPGLSTLIVADHFGRSEFAVEDPLDPRAPVLRALMDHGEVTGDSRLSVSGRNIVDRFADMEQLFPVHLQDDELPFFIYFLLERITLVEISTHSERLALETFETMNDRGLQLSKTDLLKSFVLQQTDAADHATISMAWRDCVARLVENDTSGHTTFMKNWLRVKYSRSAADDDAIGHSFDRWLRQNHAHVELRYPGEFKAFVTRDMDNLSRRYVELVQASKKPRPGFETVYFNGVNKVTLQFPLILAAIEPGDTNATFATKAAMIAGYLDIVVARRMANDHDFGYDSLAPGVFSLAREIRNANVDLLASRLGEAVAELPEGFDAVIDYTLRYGNRARTKYLLSRLSAWLEIALDEKRPVETEAEWVYKLRAHEIEHIWSVHAHLHPEVPARRFAALRNRIGDLILLTKGLNASIGDDTYEQKRRHYIRDGVLAKSLHPDFYDNNPAFRRLLDTHRLPFKPYPHTFDETAINERQRLYRLLCDLVWDPKRYGLKVPTAAIRAAANVGRRSFNVSVRLLVQKGLVPSGATLIGTHAGTDYRARVDSEGRFLVEGESYGSPSAAAAAVLDRRSAAGWTFWRLIRPDGTTASLDAIRKTALQQGIVPVLRA